MFLLVYAKKTLSYKETIYSIQQEVLLIYSICFAFVFFCILIKVRLRKKLNNLKKNNSTSDSFLSDISDCSNLEIYMNISDNEVLSLEEEEESAEERIKSLIKSMPNLVTEEYQKELTLKQK